MDAPNRIKNLSSELKILMDQENSFTDKLCNYARLISKELTLTKTGVNATCIAIDHFAQNLVPDDYKNYFTIEIKGDGNCLPRSLGMGVFNNQDHHEVLRILIAVEAILNKEHYLDNKHLSKGATQMKQDLPLHYAKNSPCASPEYISTFFTRDCIELIYFKEIQLCLNGGEQMGLWQIAQASSVLGVPIHSVYLGKHEYCHRFFYPVSNMVSNTEPVSILWTSAESGGSIGHCLVENKR